MKRFLVIYAENSGFCSLSNVGFFDANSKDEAIIKARCEWRTTAKLFAIALDELHDGWSYYA